MVAIRLHCTRASGHSPAQSPPRLQVTLVRHSPSGRSSAQAFRGSNRLAYYLSIIFPNTVHLQDMNIVPVDSGAYEVEIGKLKVRHVVTNSGRAQATAHSTQKGRTLAQGRKRHPRLAKQTGHLREQRHGLHWHHLTSSVQTQLRPSALSPLLGHVSTTRRWAHRTIPSRLGSAARQRRTRSTRARPRC